MSEIERAIEKKEYIERGALSERAEIIRKKMLTEKHEPFTIDIMNDFADLLDQYAKDIPAADVEPVVRGEWEEFDADMNAYSCSACNEPQMFIEGNPEQNEYDFCPHCGAHMKMSEPKQPDRCTTCENNGKPICSNCIMTGYGNDIDFYHTVGEA